MRTFKSHAKINIGLNIISKRDDGYHNIETIFYPINLFDEITFIESKDFSIVSELDLVPTDKNNLIWKAKSLLEKELGIKINYKVKVIKRIPIFAGLGGGSSNAATTLLALNKLLELNLAKSKLQDMALKIGSDVSFFFEKDPAFASGRGEILQLRPNLFLDYKIAVVFPRIKISTGWAYSNVKIKKPDFDLSSIRNKNDFQAHKNLIQNDFEPLIFSSYPEIGDIKSQLLSLGAEYSSLSGSGASVYGLFNGSFDENILYLTFPDYKVFIC